jgi:hypothetical protein
MVRSDRHTSPGLWLLEERKLPLRTAEDDVDILVLRSNTEYLYGTNGIFTIIEIHSELFGNIRCHTLSQQVKLAYSSRIH